MPSSRAHQDGGTSFISQVRELETQLTVAVTRATSLNPLLDLIDIALKAQSAADCSKAIYSLYRVFVLILHSGKWGLTGDATGETKVVRTWIWERFGGYVDFLLGLLKDEEKLLRVSSA
jgi:U3 small nucleolar RNA-associated protein 19